MDETATVALVAVVAGVGLIWFLKRQEAATAMSLAQINGRKQQGSSDPYALSLGDAIAVVGTAAATYAGGPGAGAKAANALAPR